jgi:hypothetical protein
MWYYAIKRKKNNKVKTIKQTKKPENPCLNHGALKQQNEKTTWIMLYCYLSILKLCATNYLPVNQFDALSFFSIKDHIITTIYFISFSTNATAHKGLQNILKHAEIFREIK